MVATSARVRTITVLMSVLIMAVALLGHSVAARAAACDDTYVAGVDGSWTTPGNWSLGTAPTSAQVACIPAGFGTIHVPAFTDVDASSLVAGSAIDVAGSSQILLHDTNAADVSTVAALTIADQAVFNSGSPVTISGNARVDGSILVQSGIGPLKLLSGGELSGIGSINAVFENVAGTVAPGDPGTPGRLTFDSTFTQDGGGTLALDLASDTVFDQLSAIDAVSLAGTVTVSAAGGYVPAVGTSWKVVSTNAGATFSAPVTVTPSSYSAHVVASGASLTLDSLPPPPSAPPPPTITTPADGASYPRNAVVHAEFSCAPGANGGVLKAGAAGCAAPVPSAGSIDTASVGAHTFTVTATDTDDQSATTTSHYTVTDVPIAPPPSPPPLQPPVLQPPPRNLTAPVIVDVPGNPHAYTCSPGTWIGAEGTVDTSGQVTTFTYTWERLVPNATYYGGYKIDTVATGPTYRPTAGSATALVLQSWLIRCVATTSNGGGSASATSAPRTLSPALGPTVIADTVNVRVSGIEVTQGVQSGSCVCTGTLPSRDQSNLLTPAQVNYQGVTMAAGKFTVVRVFANYTQPAGLASLPGATAQLEVFDASGNKTVTLSPDSSPAAIGQSLCDVCVTIKERDNPGASFNFLVPWAQTLHRALSFRATVRPPAGLGALQQCAGCDANTFTLLGVPFVPTVTVPIHPVQLTVGGVGTARTPVQVFGDTQTVLPVNVQIFPYDAPIPVGGVGPSLAAANSQTLAAVDQRAIDNSVDDTQYPIGVFDQGTSALANGVTMANKVLDGGIGPPISVVQTNRTLTSVMHEIGHGLGLVHADTGSPSNSCPGRNSSDNCGPHPDGTPDCGGNSNGQVGESWPPDNEGRLENQAVALDRRKWDISKTGSLPVTLVDGLPAATNRFYDFMSYCPSGGVSETSDWISVRNWTRLVNFKPPSSPALPARSVARARARAGSATALVLAVVNADGTTSITDVGPGQRAPGAPTSGTPFRVESHDAAGAMLSSVTPTANVIHADGQPPGVLLEATLPMTSDAASVVVSSAGHELARRARSAHAPTVSLLGPRSPLGGSATTLVRWAAKDADGDRLIATVEYSADAGRHWKVVAGNVRGSSAKVAARLLSASGNARLRVRVNDGFNMAQAASGRLIAAGTPPLVQISGAGRAGRVHADSTLLLQGSAFDDADVPLTGARLKWYAGKRFLNRGALLTVHGLKPGTTAVRLVATDSRGRSSQAQVRLRVLAPTPRLLISRAPTKVTATAHSVRIVVATADPAMLTIGGAHYALTRRPRTITVPIHPGSSILRVTYSLRSPGGVTRGVYLASR